ncbi:MAG: class I SAM-dependent methyltransferase [Leptospiraceae bacterium]|nr:class I SAM-dependent methyltransferase [Leptospiraceae bacterium]
MSRDTIHLSDDLLNYIRRETVRESAVLADLRRETADHDMARMQIAAEQGQLLQLLVKLIGARRAVEVGVFTGYSSVCIASALPSDGYLLACDVNAEYTDMARRYWERAGLSAKIELRLAPATETLRALEAQQAAPFDFAFIDADKENYDAYYESCLRLLRPGGLIAVDNVLWGGSVVDESKQDAVTRAIRALNTKIGRDERVDNALVPVADGLMLARKL